MAWKGFKATATSIVFDNRIDDLSEVAREFTYEATRDEEIWEQGV